MAVYKISSGNLMRWCFFNLLHVFLLANEVCLQESVVGFIGGSAVVPCSSKKPPLATEGIDVRWRHKYDLSVYDIVKGKVFVEGQDPQYKNRAESFPEEYLRGNFSIKLNNLQLTDAGKYKCYIMMEESVICVELLIEKRPERQLPGEGTKPRPEMIVMIISILCIGIIFSLTNSATVSF
ncbi:CD276 antigen homolog [Onychostoma macrolepis]|uniref:Ig-like domain-containing protein n=1 Tax=Onychostoma macrolepis TaxID=369639 RepID=A0A7J6BSH1_9TELE|nr:CD276 antigen homolog [Onychostoma macrolepis]KAF4097916.1 hypothetical protein G5714_021924 [Onychostoma macrolepis]